MSFALAHTETKSHRISNRIQAKLEVGGVNDEAEKEADTVAEKVMRMPSGPVGMNASGCGKSMTPLINRKCSSCEEEEKISRKAHSKGAEVANPKIEQPAVEELKIQKQPNGAEGGVVSSKLSSSIETTRGGGSNLSEHVSTEMGSKMGADFSGVKVHTGEYAHKFNSSLGARAFTIGNDIYFGKGEYDHSSPDGRKLIAHELTHTVQQGAVARRAVKEEEISTEKTEPVIRRGLGDWLADSAWSIVEGITSSTFVSTLREIYDKGIIGFLTDKIKAGLNSLFSSFPNVGGFVTNLIAVFTALYGRISSIMSALMNGDCQPLLTAVEELKNIMTEIATTAWNDLVEFVRPIGDFFSGLWTSYGAPVMNWLGQTAADVWSWMQNIGQQIWDWTEPVREYGSMAWDWVKTTLGIGSSGGEENSNGIIQWITGKAQEAWDGIKAALNPVIQPITEVVSKVTELLPLDAITNLRDTVSNMAQGVNDMAGAMGDNGSEVAAQQASLRDTILPAMQQRIVEVRDGISNAGLWISEKIGGFVGLITGFYTSLLSNEWLSFAAPAISWISDAAGSLGGWVQSNVVTLFNSVADGLGFLASFIEPIYNALVRIVDTIGDLAGRAGDFIMGPFLLIPECIRTPIKNFLIEQILMRIPLFNQIMALGDVWTRAQQVAMTILYQVFVDGNLPGAIWTFFRELLGILGIPPELVVSILANASSAVVDILANPVGFFINLLSGLKQGFTQFFDNIGTHLLNGVVNWLTGQMQSLGIQPPADFSFGSIFSFILQILGITIDNIFRLLATRIGEERAARLRSMLDMATGAWSFVRDVVERGPAAIWERIQEQLSNLWESVIGNIVTYITERIIAQATIWLLGLLDISGIMPVVNSIIAMYRAMQSFVEYFVPILQIVNQYVGMLADVARGNVAGAADFLERILGNAIPIIIGFLASQFGFGSLARRISEILGNIRERIDNGILWVIDQAIRVGGAILDAGRSAVNSVINWWNTRRDFNVEGEQHHMYFEGEGANAQLTLASNNPQHIGGWIIARETQLRRETPEPTAKLAAIRTLSRLSEELRTVTHPERAAAGVTPRTAEAIMIDMSAQVTIIGFGNANRPVPRMVYSAGFNSALPNGNIQVRYLYRDPNNHENGTSPNPSSNLVGAFDILRPMGLASGSRRWIRGHLLNDNIGGIASDSNLIPIPTAINTAMEGAFERPMKDKYDENPKSVLWQDINVSRNSTDNNFIDTFHVEGGTMDWDAAANRWEKGPQIAQYDPPSTIGVPAALSLSNIAITGLRGTNPNAATIRDLSQQTTVFRSIVTDITNSSVPISDLPSLEAFINDPARGYNVATTNNYLRNVRTAHAAGAIRY